MSIIDHFVSESIKRAELDEFLSERLRDAGYGGVEVAKTSLGVRITIQAMKPGLVIGRGGEVIRSLGVELQKRFDLSNPQISVMQVPVPELNPYIVASQIASALQRGIHFRRAGFWNLERVMKAGALGAEISIRGKLTSQRSRHEKFKAGYMPKVGDPAMRYIKTSVLNIQLKPGLWGINVKILPSDATFPDKVTIKPATEIPAEKAMEQPVEQAAEQPVEQPSTPTAPAPQGEPPRAEEGRPEEG